MTLFDDAADTVVVCATPGLQIDRRCGSGLQAVIYAAMHGGVAPATMGIGPVSAVAKALDAAALKLSDIDLIELNEAFAAQVLACTREWSFSRRLRAA